MTDDTVISMTKKVALLIAIILAVTLLAVAFIFGWFEQTDDPETTRSQLTGEQVTPELAERPILAAIIENTEAARPQTGLDSAGIVFEVVTEGDITRNLALYQEDIPGDIGPIRSLRPYFVDWLMGFDASIAHVGGSAESLQLIDERDAKSLNEQNHSGPYYRSDDRNPPHNAYVDTEELRALQEELGHEKSEFKEIPRSDDNPSEDPQATNILIDFSTPAFEVEFIYEESENIYTRHLAGEEHIDEESGQAITVKNVVVIQAAEDDADTVGATGSGQAHVFKDGEAIEATWQKNTYEDRLEIHDAEGNEIPLNRGDTWFALLPEDRTVEF